MMKSLGLEVEGMISTLGNKIKDLVATKNVGLKFCRVFYEYKLGQRPNRVFFSSSRCNIGERTSTFL